MSGGCEVRNVEKQKVPELRFPEFKDEWKTQKLGELIVEYNEYADMGSEYPLLTSSRSGLMLQSQFRDSKTTKNEEALFSVLPYGYCTYRHMSDDDVFHFNINNLVSNGLVSKEYPVFSTKNDNDLYAIVCNLNHSRKFRSFCRAQKMGGTRTRLYFNKLCQYKILFPSQKEQDKISNFFITLDNRIDLADKKLATLQTIKQGMLQKIFSQELRFKDDEGKEFPAWEKLQIGDFIQFVGGATPSKDNPAYWNGYIPWLSSKEINVGGFISKGTYAITQKAIEETGTKLVPASTPLIISRSGILANRFPVTVTTNEVAINQDIKALMFDRGKFITQFIVSLIEANSYRILTTIVKGGTTVESVNMPDMVKMKVAIPSLPEQQKIAAYFTALDRAIAAAQQKAAALRTIKRGLLQKMFV